MFRVEVIERGLDPHLTACTFRRAFEGWQNPALVIMMTRVYAAARAS